MRSTNLIVMTENERLIGILLYRRSRSVGSNDFTLPLNVKLINAPQVSPNTKPGILWLWLHGLNCSSRT
jgi:hypothetical protein